MSLSNLHLFCPDLPVQLSLLIRKLPRISNRHRKLNISKADLLVPRISLLLTGFSSHLWQLQPLVAQLRNLGVFAPWLLTASHSPRLVHQQTSLFFLWNISEPTSAATNSVWININHCYLSIGLIQMHLIWSLLPLSLLQSSLYTAAGATQQLMRWLKALQETEVDKIQA